MTQLASECVRIRAAASVICPSVDLLAEANGPLSDIIRDVQLQL